MEITSASEQETQKIGENLAESLRAGDIVCLYGRLGAGKTVLVKGIAEGLGVKKRILSPTFIFMRSYPFNKNGKKLTLRHLDLYRIEDVKELKSLNLSEIFEEEGIFILEWASKVENILPKKRIDVEIEVLNENERRITVSRH